MLQNALKRFFTNKKTYAIACACTLLGAYKFSQIGVPSFVENKFTYKVDYCLKRIFGKLVNLLKKNNIFTFIILRRRNERKKNLFFVFFLLSLLHFN